MQSIPIDIANKVKRLNDYIKTKQPAGVIVSQLTYDHLQFMVQSEKREEFGITASTDVFIDPSLGGFDYKIYFDKSKLLERLKEIEDDTSH